MGITDSFEDFKTAIFTSLNDKISDRLNNEKEHISNYLFCGSPGAESEDETPDEAEETDQTQSNAEES